MSFCVGSQDRARLAYAHVLTHARAPQFYTHGVDCEFESANADGTHGAPNPDGSPCTPDSHNHRFHDTFEAVFGKCTSDPHRNLISSGVSESVLVVIDQPSFKAFPFYVIMGNHDHYGNATAQYEYGQQHMGSGRWNFPATSVDDLYYRLDKDFTDPDGNEITVDIFMIDTIQWAGLREQCYKTVNASDQEMRLLWKELAAQDEPVTYDDAKAACAGRSSCCLVEQYYAASNDAPPVCPAPPTDPMAQGCHRDYDSNDPRYMAATGGPSDDCFAMCNNTCCRAGHGDPCYYTADAANIEGIDSLDSGTCWNGPVGPPPPPTEEVPELPEDTCADEASWPDLDHDLVCGECKVLVDNFMDTYGGSCGNYCRSIGRACSGAWEEHGDTCEVASDEDCANSNRIDSSDFICECAIDPNAEGADHPLELDDSLFTTSSSLSSECINVAEHTAGGGSFGAPPNFIQTGAECEQFCLNDPQCQSAQFFDPNVWPSATGNAYPNCYISYMRNDADLGAGETPELADPAWGPCIYYEKVYDREWCAAHGTEEVAWSVDAGLATEFLSLFGLTCADVVSAGDCDTLVADLSTKDLGPTERISAARVQQDAGPDASRTGPDAAGRTIAQQSCPVSCWRCPNGNEVAKAPRPPSLLPVGPLPAGTGTDTPRGTDMHHLENNQWTCESDMPGPATAEAPWEGNHHQFRFTCPQTDSDIGGTHDNNEVWHHDRFAARQRAWLEDELSRSTADWKIVSGHYPIWSIAEHGPIPQMVDELKPLLERHGVAMYFNGHDHNAQHANDGSLVEYFVVGAGAPVASSNSHAVWKDNGTPHPAPPAGANKFFWARTTAEREACAADLECQFDSGVNDGSFAQITFHDADTAEVELITHNGEVAYSLTKPNPRSNQPYTSTDHYRAQPEGQPQKRYVPYKKPVTAPQAVLADSSSLWAILGGMLVLTMVVGGVVTTKMKSGGAAPAWFSSGSDGVKEGGSDGIYASSSSSGGQDYTL